MSRSLKPPLKTPAAISAITVEGFKSIAEAQTLEVRPLTILAGANSSGKSSMMQPLLLLKQTLEAQYDPGPLLLNGPNVKFTSASQFISSVSLKSDHRGFSVGLRLTDGDSVGIGYSMSERAGRVILDYNEIVVGGHRLWISPKTPRQHYLTLLQTDLPFLNSVSASFKRSDITQFQLNNERCFFGMDLIGGIEQDDQGNLENNFWLIQYLSPPAATISEPIQGVIHVPGLRGHPERAYQTTATGPRYPGTFEHYVASVIADWGSGQSPHLRDLIEDLRSLGLTWKIEANTINGVQVELRVGRLKTRPKRGGDDLVNIADVGLGVSQALPVLVALRAANPGQLVYIEQPEIHLHPRAQVAMAEVLAKAALRGVRVVVETHSSLLLLATQTLVAEGRLTPEHVGLNWFIRDEKNGTTRIHAAELDEAGRFGDWPEDFDDTALDAESRYLSAAEARLIGNGKDG